MDEFISFRPSCPRHGLILPCHEYFHGKRFPYVLSSLSNRQALRKPDLPFVKASGSPTDIFIDVCPVHLYGNSFRQSIGILPKVQGFRFLFRAAHRPVPGFLEKTASYKSKRLSILPISSIFEAQMRYSNVNRNDFRRLSSLFSGLSEISGSSVHRCRL